MPNLNKLKTIMFEQGKTYKDCADALNISVTSFSNKMNEKSSFTVDEAQNLSNLLGLPGTVRTEIFLN